MRFFATAALVLAGATATLLASAPAEARWAPDGSYQRSCRHIDFDGDMLTASCQRRDGRWQNTYLDNADDCNGNIVNNNGQLECGYREWRDRRRYYSGPAGSYRDSCANIRMDGYTLRASCQRRDGTWRWTFLDDAYDCDGRIANFDGRLTCTRGRW